RRRQRGLGVNEALDLTERHVVLDDPVAAGDARVERAVGDVAGHLLRAQDAATERGIVGGRNIGARTDRDPPSGFAHQLERLLLEAALGDAEFQDLIRHVVFSRWRSTRRLLDGMAGAGLGLMPVAGAVFGGIDFALLDDFPCARVELAEKARLVAQVAGGAVAALLDGDYQRVGVAVDANLADDLKISRLFALAPKLVARAREVTGAAGGDRLVERFAVHVGNGQDAVAQVVDGDCGDDAA